MLDPSQQTNGALHEQPQWFYVTLSRIGDAVITTGNDGRVTFLNPVAVSLTGWTQEDAAGQPLETIFRIINEHSRRPVENLATKALREGVVVGLGIPTLLIAKDGTERPIDDSAALIRDAQGHVVGSVLVFRDITDRRRAEHAIAVSEIRYRRLFESAKDGILILNADTAKITDANPFIGELLDYSLSELMGKELWEIGLFKDIEANKVAVQELQEKHYIRYEDLPLKTKTGRLIDVEFVSNVYIEGQQPVIQCNIRDITDRKRLASDLRQYTDDLLDADRRKNEFLAMLAHELRNPLAPIRNALQIMRLTGTEGQAVQLASAMMERQINQMVRLVDDLLDISRISRGKIELQTGRIELASSIRHAVEAVRSLYQNMNHELTVTLPPQPIYLNADPTRLAQVVGNLLNNACKFTDKGGHIALVVEREGSHAIIRVRDSGIGITAEELSRIFDMFVQGDTSLERAVSGLGIGLTLVKNLVEMHGGTVEAKSAGKGQGSEFVVRLPIIVEAPILPPPVPNDSELPTTTGYRILVVDDNYDSATSLAMLLKLTGNEMHVAYDGLEAVEAAATFKPDVILLDIGLPKLNGYEACRRIRELPSGKKIVIVALTDWGQEEDQEKSRHAGFDSHIVKPVELAVLTRLLAELLPPPL